MLSERMEPYSGPVSSAGRATRYGFVVCGAIVVISIALNGWIVTLIRGPMTRDTVELLYRTERWSTWLMVAALLAFVVQVVLFLVWEFKAAQAVALREDIETPPITPGWHVGWWFIPVANLVMPAVAIGQLYRASDGGPDRSWSKLPFPMIVLGWWLLWFAGAGLNRISLDQMGSAATPRAIADAVWLGMAGSVIYLLALALAMKIVKVICSYQATWPGWPVAKPSSADAPEGIGA